MWNKTGLLSPITSGSQLSELFIESESDWHLAQSETSCVVDTLPFLGSLRGGFANQVPPKIIGLQLVTCRKVSLRLCLFKPALRYVIYVPLSFLVHPPQACPGSQCMCVHEERYWLQFLKTIWNYETLLFGNISKIRDILFEHYVILHHLPANQGTACFQVGFAAHNHYLDDDYLGDIYTEGFVKIEIIYKTNRCFEDNIMEQIVEIEIIT